MDLKEMTDNENRHPWELSRTTNLIKVCKEFLFNKENGNKTLKIGDIGAGDRYFDNRLITELKNENFNPVIYAVDNKYENTYSSQKEIVLLQDTNLLERNSMDCIIMMDVLEHVREDDKFLKLVLDKMKDKGILIITVPAFETLFSAHDVYLKHYRRYNYRVLRNLLVSNNLRIIRSHYFYSSLCIARWLQLKFKKDRKTERKNVGIGTWKYNEKSFITKSIEFILNVDFNINVKMSKLSNFGLPGLSLLAVAIKETY